MSDIKELPELDEAALYAEEAKQLPLRLSVLALVSSLVGVLVMISALTALTYSNETLSLSFDRALSNLQVTVLVSLLGSVVFAFVAFALAVTNIIRNVRSVFGWVMLVVILLISGVQVLGFQTVTSLVQVTLT